MKDRILSKILEIREERSILHGKAEANLQTIAKLWSIYLGHTVSAVDVGLMMALLKMARYKGGDQMNLDNFIDGANYIALAGDLLHSDDSNPLLQFNRTTE